MSITHPTIPLSQLPALQTNLEGMRDAGNDLLATLEKVKPKPHVLDDGTINHIKRVYRDQQKEIKYYQNVLTQWLQDTPIKQQTLKTFEDAIQAVTDIHKQVFFLIDFFKDHTIEKILMKEDAELAIDLLTGSVFPPDVLDETSATTTLVPSKLIDCRKCGVLIAHLVFAEDATIANIEHHAVIMHDLIKQKNIDTWIIGEPLEIQGEDALAYIMKAWPKKTNPLKMLSSDFNDLLEKLDKMHC